MRHGMRLGVIATALSVFAVGCATEEWTQNLFTKRQAEVDERFARAETEARTQGQRIDRVEGRVAHLEVTLTETRDQVRDALAQSPITVPARRIPPGRRPAPSATDRAGVAARTLVGVIHVPFGFDRADLDAGAEAALASIVKELREHPNITIDLEGTTDSVGQFDYNVRLSQRRVAAVKRWLTEKGVERTRIIGSTGRGPVADSSVKDSAKRRVMVKLMTPGD